MYSRQKKKGRSEKLKGWEQCMEGKKKELVQKKRMLGLFHPPPLPLPLPHCLLKAQWRPQNHKMHLNLDHTTELYGK